MKVKILLVPLIIAVSIGLAIWLVYPAYSNGKDGVKEKYEQLKKEEQKLSEMKEKNSNVEKLFSEMSALSSEKDILYKFIPENIKEEEIINNISRIASDSGIAVSDVYIKSSIEKKATVVNKEEKVSALPTNKESRVSVKLVGRYEKIKEFLEKIYKTDRYSNLEILQIENDFEKSEKNNATMLAISLEMDFSILEKTKITDGNINDAVFSSASMDTTVVELIKKQKEIANNPINIEKRGKTNLFIP
jgi:Tfp pilus assembly protein PilO